MKYLVASQLYADAEAQLKGSKQILDDCTWSSCAAAVSWASGYAVTYTAAQGVAAFEKATGRKDKQGVSDAGGSLAEAVKVIAQLGGKARYAKSWADAIEAAKKGAALMVWVQQPIGYPTGLKVSAWHDRWAKWWAKTDPAHLRAGYGHMTSAGWCEDHGWQWACPTRDEKTTAEKYAVPVTEDQLRQIANSKVKAGKLSADFKALLIVTHPARTAAPIVTGGRVDVAEQPKAAMPTREVQPLTASIKPAPKPASPTVADQVGKALEGVDWEQLSGRALTAATGAAAAASKVKGAPAKMMTFLKYIKDNTGIDEALIEFVRTFVTVSISVALGLGIPLLDISGGDFRTVLSAGLASGLQVLVKYLDPKNSAFGIKEKP
ncbi:MAG: hypothetical protein EBR73_12885 [Rhodobacteraceae bacterium]|nr:hypothetical protein [Paracoccaceae bacterium]